MEIRLQAISVSDAVLRAAERASRCSVLGVHEGGLNLLCGDDVFSLVGPDVGNLPRGIVAASPAGAGWKTPGLLPGEAAVLRPGELSVPGWVHLSLAGAAVWNARRHLRAPFAAARQVRAAAEAAAAALAGAGGLGVLGPRLADLAEGRPVDGADRGALVRAALPAIAGLVRATRERNGRAFVGAARPLLGLGIGLTPSGDDLLTGLIGSLVLMAEHEGRLAWAEEAAGRLVAEAVGRTTRVGFTYLRCAAAGEITERHHDMLTALVAGDELTARAACAELRGFGHSSGGEMALGALLAVSATRGE